MHWVKKRPFTLIEILVVIFILSLGVMVTGVKVREMVLEQRFLSETEQVLSQLAMAQELMLIMDADVKVIVAKDRDTGNYQISLNVEKPLEDPWARFVERKIPLKAIQSVTFEDRNDHPLELLFSLGKMSQGTLVLHDREDREAKIKLSGYPQFIKISAEESGRPRNERDAAERSEHIYPKEVYEKIYKDPNQTHQ